MAEKIVRNVEKKDAPAQKAAQTVKKAEPAAKKAAETVKRTETEAKKPQTVITPNKPTGGSTIGLRIGAIVLWLVAIAFEILAIMAITKDFTIRFTNNGNTNLWIILIGCIVLDLAACIIAAQLWKKANHIHPMSEKRGKFLFYLWNELGVIMVCICFIPLIILLLKNKKLDGKMKTIVSIVAIVALLIAGAASADYHPISQEQQAAAAEAPFADSVYWTQFGHRYHVYEDCSSIRNSSTLYKGPVLEAIESGRTAMCQFCANRAEKEGIDLSNMNIEGGSQKEAVDPEINIVGNTAAPTATGGN